MSVIVGRRSRRTLSCHTKNGRAIDRARARSHAAWRENAFGSLRLHCGRRRFGRVRNRFPPVGRSVRPRSCFWKPAAPTAMSGSLLRTAPGSFGRQDFDWGYTTVPQPAALNRSVYWPRGKVLGGSSCLNAMIYVRGAPADYDHWAYLGNAGWDYESVLPYFKKSEDYYGGASRYHGVGGPLTISRNTTPNPLTDAFIDGGRPRRPSDQPRFFRAGAGRRRLHRHDDPRWTQMQRRGGVSGAGAQPAQPHGRNRSRAPPAPDRGRALPRGRLRAWTASQYRRGLRARWWSAAAPSARRIFCCCPASGQPTS